MVCHLRLKTELHAVIAYGFIALIILWVFLWRPYHMKGAETLLFASIALIFSNNGLRFNRTFSGYGVAKEINALAKEPVLYDFDELLWNGRIPCSMVYVWIGIVTLWAFLAAVSITLSLTAPINNELLAVIVPRLLVTFIAAWVCAYVVQIYVWLMEDRLCLWHIDERTLRENLTCSKCPLQKVDSIVRQAYDRQLLRQEPPRWVM